MAWRRPGDKSLSELMMVRLPTHICVTRPQWVNLVQVSSSVQLHEAPESIIISVNMTPPISSITDLLDLLEIPPEILRFPAQTCLFSTLITGLTPCWAGPVLRYMSHPAAPITRLSAFIFVVSFLECIETTSWTTTSHRVHLRQTRLHIHLTHLLLHGFMSPGGVLQHLQCNRIGFLQEFLPQHRIRTLINKLVTYGLVDICKVS